MKVGPESAGAVPGPACYDKGGTEPTVTDANVFLGRLPLSLAGGGLQINRARAEAVITEIAEYYTKELGHQIPANYPLVGSDFNVTRAGIHADGQLMICSDVLGIFQAFTPKFVKKYCDVAGVVTSAMKEYVAEVRAGKFPEDNHCYHMIAGEKEKFDAEF